MAGTEASGNKPLGRYTMADRLAELHRRMRLKFEADGIDPEEQDILDEHGALTVAEEMLGQKQALCVALLKDLGVIGRAERLADGYAEAWGPLDAPVWELIAAKKAA
jgi:hypothetical protein